MRDPIHFITATAIEPQYRRLEVQEDGTTTRLSKEVQHVIRKDPMYGPQHDAERHRVGVEYEDLLEEILDSMSKFLLWRGELNWCSETNASTFFVVHIWALCRLLKLLLLFLLYY